MKNFVLFSILLSLSRVLSFGDGVPYEAPTPSEETKLLVLQVQSLERRVLKLETTVGDLKLKDEHEKEGTSQNN
jgi:hypothetical protein